MTVTASSTMKITQALLAEHVVFHNLFDHLEQAVPKLKSLLEVRALAALLESMLKVHSVIEDTLLVEPIEPSLSQIGQDQNFHEEHEAIDADLARVRATRKLDEGRRRLLRAVALARRHFDKEERIVFPLAEKILSPRTLLELGKRWEAQRKDLVA
jgi:hemerythrin-like domain-containing protein